MRTKAEIISLLTKPGVIAVVRAQKAEQVCRSRWRSLAGRGSFAIEITMTTPNAIAAIREVSEQRRDGFVGVGTVLDGNTCKAAIDAGAGICRQPDLPDGANRNRPRRESSDYDWLLYAHGSADRPRSGRGFHQTFSRRRIGRRLYQIAPRAASASEDCSDRRCGPERTSLIFQCGLCRGGRRFLACLQGYFGTRCHGRN